MIAMQYTINLPADYDMDIIERRIRDKGPALDGFPHLRFKAYLSARKQAARPTSGQNLYAPFYLWDDTKGLSDFLCGPGFAVLSQDFGRPTVETWCTWQANMGSDLRAARFASRKVTSIDRYSDLAVLREEARSQANQAMDQGAIAAVAAFDPGDWTTVLFLLWETLPDREDIEQTYDVGYVALP